MRTSSPIFFRLFPACILFCAPAVVAACSPSINVGTIDDEDGGAVKDKDGGGEPLGSECVPSDAQSPVADACGIFVRLAGNDTNAGTKSEPVATLARAIQLAMFSKKAVYACAETFPESISVPEGTTIFGGLNCTAGWTYIGPSTKTTIAPNAGEIPLKFIKENGKKIRIEDVIAAAADADRPGKSSIAAIVDAVVVELVRSELIAGNGMAGEDGEQPSGNVQPENAADPAIMGNAGNPACTGGDDGNAGAPEKANASCPISIGGAGGNGRLANKADNGKDGVPLPNPNPSLFGLGGVGQMGSLCKAGQNGDKGWDGTNGGGATQLGSIDFDGYTGGSGEAGKPGWPGQGGGGGGGALGKTNCFGASGGSGGAGGCGGLGGRGGQGGGSSIALISLGATLVFDNVKLTTGHGGNGGGGGTGQSGGIGGDGGDGGPAASTTVAACKGGGGGVGGTGGRGGGGLGGHSIGIAYLGNVPNMSDAAIMLGYAGAGGLGAEPTDDGAAGVAVDAQMFP